MARRYAAWHSSEPGYETVGEVEEFISRQGNPDEYRVVATDDDFDPDCEGEKFKLEQRERDCIKRIEAAVQQERARLINNLVNNLFHDIECKGCHD